MLTNKELEEYKGDVLYEVEQENRNGGGNTLDVHTDRQEAMTSAWSHCRDLTSDERRRYTINVNTWRWNGEDGQYAYEEGCEYIEDEEDE